MTNRPRPSTRDRILGGLWGSLVGDALGVPVEFKDHAAVRAKPVTDMRGFGTHHQPPGTWSDDSSLLLCSVDSVISHEFDTQDMGNRFVRWYNQELWTPHGKVFDVGVATAESLRRIATGVSAEFADGDSQFSNGNGSLMRIIPVPLKFARLPLKELLDRTHRASAITHRHARSQLACGFHALLVRELLAGASPAEAHHRAAETFRAFYDSDPFWPAELDYFRLVLSPELGKCEEAEINSRAAT
jgi:ADP-ribosyl-[dinitrogen reductase] hydrolase